MAVYNMNGNESNAYSLNGTQLQSAYDINGNDILSYSINNVVSYFRDRTLEVAGEINQLSDDWTSFIFITDQHGTKNKDHSQAISLYLLDNTPCTMIVLGGDYSRETWSKTEFDNHMRPYVESPLIDKIYAIFGNHETKGGTSYATTMAESLASIYNSFLKDKTDITGNLEQNYYYLDDTARKIRYMFINTSGTSQYNMTTDEITWINQNVQLPSTDWSLVVIGHVTLCNMGGLVEYNESNGATIINNIKTCNGTIIGYICGHQHIDYLYNDGSMEHVTLMCDTFENTNWVPGYSITNRIVGTMDEQAVTTISINTKTKQVVLRRIGSGLFQTTSYTYS